MDLYNVTSIRNGSEIDSAVKHADCSTVQMFGCSGLENASFLQDELI